MKKLLIIIFLIFTLSSFAQEKKLQPFKVGWNAMQLVGKSADFFAEKEVLPKTALYADLGYTFAPPFQRGFALKDDGIELKELTGFYYKLGAKYSIIRREKIDLWAGLLVIGSNYIESAYNTMIEEEVSAEGFVWGWAFFNGIDINPGEHLAFRFGLQKGFYHRDDHLGSDIKTHQPGFGTVIMDFNTQLIIAIIYKI
jgi:hypothetical protein